jgi:antitoxin component of MazEF toxin-antitoxin module
MKTRLITLQVEEDGGIRIPAVVLQELGAVPGQEVEVTLIRLPTNKLVMYIKLAEQDRANLERIGEHVE